MKQTTFASLTFDAKKNRTRHEVFRAEMEQVIPWSGLEAIIEPHYPKGRRRGRPPMPLGTMLRIHFMQQWYALSDRGIPLCCAESTPARTPSARPPHAAK